MQSGKTTPQTTPTKRVAYRQKEILTTPRSSKQAQIAKTLYTGPNYVKPLNFEDDTEFSEPTGLVGKTIQVGNSFFTYGKNMAEYKDSTTLYRSGQRQELLKRLDADGYILIRGAVQYDTALTGRNKLVNHLAKKDAIDTKKGTLSEAFIKNVGDDGWTVDAETGGFVNNRETDEAIDGWREIGWCPEVRNVYNGEDIHAVYRFLWGKPRTKSQDGYVALSQNTWLRAKGKGEVTSEHADYYYFKQNTTTFQENRHPYVENAAELWNEENPIPDGVGKSDIVECDICLRQFIGSQQIPKATAWDKDVKGEWHCHDCASGYSPFYTCWISLGEYKDENSTLCMMPKTQNLKQFDRPLRTDLLPEDYNDLVKSKWGWLRTNFGLGDIVIFNWKTVHGASKNTMTQFRFSIDTRVCSSWIRPEGLFGANSITYNYPKEDLKTFTVGKEGSGSVDSKEFTPSCENVKCPTVLSTAFLEKEALLAKSGVQRKRRIGNISSKPKVMGMGMGMGANCKKNPKSKKTQSQNDESEAEIEENHCELDAIIEQPRKNPPRSQRLIKNKNLGIDGVGRFGNDDEEFNEDTDHSQRSQSQEILTPSKRQHRILREKDALIYDVGFDANVKVDKFDLGVIDEGNEPVLYSQETNGNKTNVRKAASQLDCVESEGEGNEQGKSIETNKRQRR